jgi:nitrogen fixation/metabolism regulation signal transduction histidine kinase
MIGLTFTASILILIITISQYKEESEDYHKKRLYRKEKAVKSHIKSILDNTDYEVKTEKLPYIFRKDDNISELSRIHKMPINIYDLNGKLLIGSRRFFGQNSDSISINMPDIIKKIDQSEDKRYVIKHENQSDGYQSSYSYIYDEKFKPIGILNLPYLADNSFYKKELEEFLKTLASIYFFMFLLSILVSFILSRYITKSLKTVNDLLEKTSLSKQNEKIIIKNANDEINQLITSYNNMVDKLEESAKKLAQTEREEAWRNMARQVAHEIKNPLTPMRLNIQSFQMTFDPNDPDIKQKFNEFGNTLIQQIDLMSNIATAFSNFAKMPHAQLVENDLIKVVRDSINLYDEENVKFISNKNEIIFNFDKNQIQRVITNLVKNAFQAVPNDRKAKIIIAVDETPDLIKIIVSDNGTGISENNRPHVFEPKFTTKSSGMGLGLAIVKKIIENHNGIIYFNTKINEGTSFIIELKK